MRNDRIHVVCDANSAEPVHAELCIDGTRDGKARVSLLMAYELATKPQARKAA